MSESKFRIMSFKISAISADEEIHFSLRGENGGYSHKNTTGKHKINKNCLYDLINVRQKQRYTSESIKMTSILNLRDILHN